MRKKVSERRYIHWICCYVVLLCFFCLNTEKKKANICSSLDEARGERGGCVLLVFFSTDCSVCWNDLFEMKYYIEKNNLPVQIIGVSKDSRQDLEIFLEKYSYFEPVISDRGGQLYQKFGVDLEPYKVILEEEKIMYKDDYYEDFYLRRKKAQECLLRLAQE